MLLPLPARGAAASCALIALAGAAVAQAPTRVFVEHGADSGQVVTAPGVTSVATTPSTGASVSLRVLPRPFNFGVRLAAVGVVGFVEQSATAEVVGIDPNGTSISLVAHGNTGACGGGCEWGPFDNSSTTAPGSSGTPVAPGEARVVEATGRYSFDAVYTPQSWQWAYISPGEWFVASAASEAWMSTGPPGHNPAIDVRALEASATAELTLTTTYELEPLAITPYCSSQANGTGQHGELEAFGWPAAGDDWLTIRARQLPDGAAAILFVGTLPTSIPGGTTTTCVAGAVRRTGGVQIAAGGKVDFDVDLTGWLPGEVARFQVFHRDPVHGVAATGAAALTVQ